MYKSVDVSNPSCMDGMIGKGNYRTSKGKRGRSLKAGLRSAFLA
jgi:hypothetical protein